MTNSHLILSAVFAVVLSSTASAGSITTSNGASCNDSYNYANNDNQSVSFGSDSDYNGNVSFNVKYTYSFGGNKRHFGYTQRINCGTLLHIEEQKQQLELQRLQLQVAQLQRQLQDSTSSNTLTTSDDW